MEKKLHNAMGRFFEERPSLTVGAHNRLTDHLDISHVPGRRSKADYEKIKGRMKEFVEKEAGNIEFEEPGEGYSEMGSQIRVTGKPETISKLYLAMRNWHKR